MSNKQKTAIMELMDEVAMEIGNNLEISTKLFYTMLKKKLEKERQQMIDHSFNFYYDLSNKKNVPFNLISENRILAEEYFKEQYEQQHERP